MAAARDAGARLMGRFGVLGATSWGTTLAWLLACNGHDVWLLCRDGTEARRVDAARGLARLPGLVLSDSVAIVEAARCPVAIDGLIVAVPAQAAAKALSEAALPRSTAILSAAKGIDHTSRLRMSELCGAAGWQEDHVAVLSGPNLAKEVVAGLPAAGVVASASEATAEAWQRALSRPAFRLYTSPDVVGVELCGSLKNVVAIAAGSAIGLGFGANAVAAILTRGLAEMTRLGLALGAQRPTFQGLAGVGDLAATCYSPLSRNRRMGELLAGGSTVAECLAAIGEAVEGVETAPVALALALEAGVDMPITEQVCAVLEGRATVPAAMATLLDRPLKAETADSAPVLD